jgi:putative modified peptide
MAEDMNFGAFAMTPGDAEGLLGRLEGDDDFRAWVQTDPEAALRSVGILIARDKLPATVELPSPAEIAELRRTLETQGAIADDQQWWHPFLAVAMIFSWHPFFGRGGESES